MTARGHRREHTSRIGHALFISSWRGAAAAHGPEASRLRDGNVTLPLSIRCMATATRATNGLRTDQQAGTKMRQLASHRVDGKRMAAPPLSTIRDDALAGEAVLGGVLTTE